MVSYFFANVIFDVMLIGNVFDMRSTVIVDIKVVFIKVDREDILVFYANDLVEVNFLLNLDQKNLSMRVFRLDFDILVAIKVVSNVNSNLLNVRKDQVSFQILTLYLDRICHLS